MKTMANLTALAMGLFLMGALLVAQDNYQKSFGGIEQSSPIRNEGSIASYHAGYEAVAMDEVVPNS